MDINVEVLAGQIHADACNAAPDCPGWANSSSLHRKFYNDKAQTIIVQLEPVIGMVNVLTAVRVIMAELG